MSNLHAERGSELQQIIEITEQELRNAHETPFTPRAFDNLKEKLSEYSVQLIAEAVKLAKRHQSETVSSTHVEHASEYLVSSTSHKIYRHLGTVGGLLIGVAGSGFVSMFSTNQFTPTAWR
jgi:DNA helicase TIP49 (TBP-interacting protein)